MAPRVGVVVFPGTNCELDAAYALEHAGAEAVTLFHADTDLQGVDAILLPGGFSYGDHLRCGALARFTPIMVAIAEFAAAGGPVLGICNGFQILCEADLLPGILTPNHGRRFICREISTGLSPHRRAAELTESGPRGIRRALFRWPCGRVA